MSFDKHRLDKARLTSNPQNLSRSPKGATADQSRLLKHSNVFETLRSYRTAINVQYFFCKHFKKEKRWRLTAICARLGLTAGGKCRSGTCTEPLWDWPLWRKWHRAGAEKEWTRWDLRPLKKVVTRTQSWLGMLYLNLKPDCVCLRGQDTALTV